MTSSTLPAVAFNPAEPIPGYRVQERIGTGGYGDVWRAQAPGGITKAIKIVYGYHDPERAQRELHALNRIKEVRHPFLLSLERIEIVDGHLLIVSELASSSLKNLCDEHRQAGRPGIPRDELLTHLKDAADALDYIYQKHSLQHLDVKPENLLLVGGRIKVADFGLVKDLGDVNCSNMGGLTPVYAPPELFDGRPSNHSDQYSLAIVYQEMLTGVPPFAGRTTAQLAAQHLHSRPQVDCLPAWDQATIVRALSKDPTRRFESCRAMVESLLAASTSPQRPRAVGVSEADTLYRSLGEPVKTQQLGWNDASSQDDAASGRGGPRIVAPAADVQDLPPIEIQSHDVPYRPTLVVGIGGLAARTLQLLRRRLHDRFGDAHGVPAVQMLLLETDSETLTKVTEGEHSAALPNSSVVLLPLRPPADYRRGSVGDLKWLNRRWIYNIPRSLQTQGLRPLGRLALLDYRERVVQRIRLAIQAAVAPEALAASARTTGLGFQAGMPRVFIVSSMSGGTGSGMVLDVAYMVRQTLREMELSDDDVCGLLAHCTGRHPHKQDISVANSYACLTELNHYSQLRHAFAGNPESGSASFEGSDAPFNNAYVVHLGEDLDPQGFDQAADKLAAYLYSNAVTAAGAFFDKCRGWPRASQPSASDQPTLRTVGLCQLGLGHDDVPADAVGELCRVLVKRWREPEALGLSEQPLSLADPTSVLAQQSLAEAADKEMRADVRKWAIAVGLNDVAGLFQQLSGKAAEFMGGSPDAYLLKVLEQMIRGGAGARSLWNRLPPTELLVDTLDGLIHSLGLQSVQTNCLESLLGNHLVQWSNTQGSALQDMMTSLISLPRHRLIGAQRAADHVSEHLRALSREAGELLNARRRELVALEQVLRNDKKSSTVWLKLRGFRARRRLVVDQRLSQYFRSRIDELVLNGICRLIGLVLGQIAVFDDKLRNQAADLNRLAEELLRAPAANPDDGSTTEPPDPVRRLVSETIEQQKTALVTEMDRKLEGELLRIMKMEEKEARAVLPRILFRTAHTTLLEAIQALSLKQLAAAEHADEQSRFSLRSGLNAAVPKLNQCGGARRLVLIASDEFSPAPLADVLGSTATVVADGGKDVLVCYEAEALSVPHLAAALLDNRLENVEVAARLHTRVDVRWSPL